MPDLTWLGKGGQNLDVFNPRPVHFLPRQKTHMGVYYFALPHNLNHAQPLVPLNGQWAGRGGECRLMTFAALARLSEDVETASGGLD